MTDNAQYIYAKFLSQGWSKNSICAMLGNMQSESTINAGVWENLDEGNMKNGFGLVQWTPATEYTNWADQNKYPWANLDGQIACLQWELDNNKQWLPTSEYPMTFKEFSKSADSPYNLALVFIKNYERPLNPNQPIRGTQAEYWYKVLVDPPIPPDPTIKKKMPIYFYLRKH